MRHPRLFAIGRFDSPMRRPSRGARGGACRSTHAAAPVYDPRGWRRVGHARPDGTGAERLKGLAPRRCSPPQLTARPTPPRAATGPPPALAHAGRALLLMSAAGQVGPWLVAPAATWRIVAVATAGTGLDAWASCGSASPPALARPRHFRHSAAPHPTQQAAPRVHESLSRAFASLPYSVRFSPGQASPLQVAASSASARAPRSGHRPWASPLARAGRAACRCRLKEPPPERDGAPRRPMSVMAVTATVHISVPQSLTLPWIPVVRALTSSYIFAHCNSYWLC